MAFEPPTVRESLFLNDLWAMTVVRQPNLLLTVDFLDGDSASMTVRHHHRQWAKGLRMVAKSTAANLNGLRALSRSQQRRARYWLGVARHWLERCESISP